MPTSLSSDSPEVGSPGIRRFTSSFTGCPLGSGILPNAMTMLLCQAVALGVAIGLDALHHSDATIVIILVLGVLITAILTDGPLYSLVASSISMLSYNFFLIDPRLTLQIQGRYYVGTLMAMFLFALLASYLVAGLRRSYHLSHEASLIAEREQLRANLLRSVSHDLRTPLTSITGNADMLLDEQAQLSEPVRRQLLEDIYRDATWLSSVVQNLLSVTRLEDGDTHLNTEIEVVDDVIEEAMRHVSRDASRHHIQVVPSDELLLARMDSQVIVQVIVNLVNNAIEHTDEDSTITISSDRKGDVIEVRVTDDGPGVSDEDKAQVFEPFYTSGDCPDAGRSIGLGLSLCRSIVHAHGGQIFVEDAAPQGASFVFTLPAEEVPAHE